MGGYSGLWETDSQRFGRKGGRGGRIRTGDPSVPNRVLYQAEPRPDSRNSKTFALPAPGQHEVGLCIPMLGLGV